MNHDDSGIDALLIGYENQENLGLRSIMAYLLARGYSAVIVPFFPGRRVEILEIAREMRPRLVGFSLIFQYTLDEFGGLMQYLRSNDLRAHFTAGGHFPSLRPMETLEMLPQLDSIVRFEGELTLPELLDHLDQPDQWNDIQSLAYRTASGPVLTPTRPLISDLDSLPTVYRDQPPKIAGGIPMAFMLASRGCLFNCSFCSIRQFYGSTLGELRRVRSPAAVVGEMSSLFHEKGVRFFSFQDDDFAARTGGQSAWLKGFLKALAESRLPGKIQWKISCRVDDIEADAVKAMLDHGLMAVYLGVESGNDAGLRALNKHVNVSQNLAAIELLKRFNIALSIGFMMFDPSSTTESIRKNIAFLRTVGEDGYFPINFCKMLPYAGTPIEGQLRDTGRLKGTTINPDYDFTDTRLDWYAFLVQRIFTKRNFNSEGLVARLQQVDFDNRLSKAFGIAKKTDRLSESLRQIISRTNLSALDTLQELLDAVISQGAESLLQEQATLLRLAENEWRMESSAEIELERIHYSGTTAAVDSSDPRPALHPQP